MVKLPKLFPKNKTHFERAEYIIMQFIFGFMPRFQAVVVEVIAELNLSSPRGSCLPQASTRVRPKYDVTFRIVLMYVVTRPTERAGYIAGASAPGPGGPKGALRPPQKN